VFAGAAQLQLRLLFGGYLYIKKIMAVIQPVISEAFLDETNVNILLDYRVYDVLSNAYIGDGTTIWFRGNFYTLNAEDGYLYTRVGFAMATNPFLFDPMSFKTPRIVNGQWEASFMQLNRGRPTRYGVTGMNYYDTYNELISAYTNNVVPG
jgi:hypothetical protein